METKFVYGVLAPAAKALKKALGKSEKGKQSPLQPPVEILWEITPECDKNCFFCGSKDIIGNRRLPDADIFRIAARITEAKNRPAEVTLSGGEPGTLSYEVLRTVVGALRYCKIKVKAVTNGKLIEAAGEDRCFIDSFERIGLSINSAEDARNLSRHSEHYDNITVITNFGRHNIFDFDEIAECAKKFGHWQVQLTEGNELTLPADMIGHLWDRIIDKIPYAVLADNAQVTHQCMSGTHGCSITYDGDVVPCLSMRSWLKGKLPVVGNILKKNFDSIWVDGFRKWRSQKCRMCCRDGIKYPNWEQKFPFGSGAIVIQQPREIHATYYAVTTPDANWPEPKWVPWPGTQVYSVHNPPTIVMYNVSGPQGSSVSYTISASSGGQIK